MTENVARVEKAINKDRRITYYHQLEKLLNISVSSLRDIVKNHLSVEKHCTFWAPHALTGTRTASYSPELAFCAFGLFFVQNRMNGRKFPSKLQLIGTFEEEI